MSVLKAAISTTEISKVAPIPGALSWKNYLHMNVQVTDKTVCKRLQMDLIEH
jgi:hypothetical protein